MECFCLSFRLPRFLVKRIIVSRLVPILIPYFILFVLFCIPGAILGYGYLPPDDALRHAAKVISGKSWDQILVLRNDIKMDSHPGWHTILGFVHKIIYADTYSLVFFSVVFLFFIFMLVPVLFLHRPEAWLITLLIITVANPSPIFRVLLGRPYIVTMSVIFALGFLWPNLRHKKPHYLTITMLSLLIAVTTWIHGGWYFFLLPLFSFFVARQWRAGFIFIIVIAIGTIIGASFTGHPYIFLKQTIQHVFLAYGTPQRFLVTEFQPFTGDFFMVIVIVLMLIWRLLRDGLDIKSLIHNPMVILAITCWGLGFVTTRVWVDIGIPAVILWISQQFQEFLDKKMAFLSCQRFLLTMILLGIVYVAITHDGYGRWSESRPKAYLLLENREIAPWLPGAGGIVYSDSMDIFYQTFFKNPHAPWRYVLGFEPGFMPSDDLSIYHNIQLSHREFVSFEPWVKKMKPEDRLIIRHVSEKAPAIDGLQWHYVLGQIWIGRLPEEDKVGS